MKHLIVIATVIASATAFANDPAAHGTHSTGTTQSDPTTPQTPNDKNAKTMKKHKGTAGKDHPSMNKTGNSEQNTDHTKQ